MEGEKNSFYKINHDACDIGMVINMDGRADHKLVNDALHIAEKLANCAEGNISESGTCAAGIQLQISHCFFRKIAEKEGIFLKTAGDYGIGMFFFPREEKKRIADQQRFEILAENIGLCFIGWRRVKVHPEILARTEQEQMPFVCQGFVARPQECDKGIDFDKKLYQLRRLFEERTENTHVCSLSSRTIVYKGIFSGNQLSVFYEDLESKWYKSAMALIHVGIFADADLRWTTEKLLSGAVLFSEGDLVGATLDRKGLRSARYYIRDDARLLLSTRAGVAEIPAENIVKKSRLQPGKMLLVDIKQKKLIADEANAISLDPAQACDDENDMKDRWSDHDNPAWRQYAAVEEEESERTLRTLLQFSAKELPLAIDEVEPVSEILKRFKSNIGTTAASADAGVDKQEIQLKIMPGVRMSISVIPSLLHYEIYCIEELAQLIYDLKNTNPRAKISVKLISGEGIDTIAADLAKAGAQVIEISDTEECAERRHGNCRKEWPWERGLAAVQQTLIRSGLREKVLLRIEGEMLHGRDLAIAALLGAEEFAEEKCPKSASLMQFTEEAAGELREIMAMLGFRTVNEMIGRYDVLTLNGSLLSYQDAGQELFGIMNQRYAREKQRRFMPFCRHDFHLEQSLDACQILPTFFDALNAGKHQEGEIQIDAACRSAGVLLGYEITRRYNDTLQEDNFIIHAKGSSGASFGAFIPAGLTMKLEGESDEGFGRGLSGGKLIIVPAQESQFKANENIITGNDALYGAVAGKAYICGMTGDAFCAHNAGAIAVAEGCGNDALKDMTEGLVVLLGSIGINFAAGMRGGLAYVLDEKCDLHRKMDPETTMMEEVAKEKDIYRLKSIIQEYEKETGSALAGDILMNFAEYLPYFKKVTPANSELLCDIDNCFEEKENSPANTGIEAFDVIVA